MILDKSKVANKFDMASETYDEVASIQKECAMHLVEKLNAFIGKKDLNSILDLGTGTGYVPELLLKIFPSAHYDLNDIAPSMLEYVKNKFGKNAQFDYILGDLENLVIDQYDLIISNLALQWTDHLMATLKKQYSKSSYFAFTCLLEGTFREWSQKFEEQGIPLPTYVYPSSADLETFLLALNPKRYFFEVKDFTLSFNGSLEFIKYLKKLGGSFARQSVSSSEIKKIIELNQEPFEITYRVFFAILERK